MSLNKYRFDGNKKLDLESLPTDSRSDGANKDEIKEETAKLQSEISSLQDRLYADGHEGLLIILQAMDAAGKDSTVKHVMSGINPQGVQVHSFKQPSSEELSHDFLWRINAALPRRGMIALFNRSYYEDVLVWRVDELNKTCSLPQRLTGLTTEEFYARRYRQLKHYETYLYENGYRILKLFLNVSKEEQKKRFLERIDTPEKNWKFSSADLKVRNQWNAYMSAYEAAINATATKENPWYVIPADQKWYTRYLVSKAIYETLKDIDPHYPQMPQSEKEQLNECRKILLHER